MENGGPSREAITSAPEMPEQPLFDAPETSGQHIEYPSTTSEHAPQVPESLPDTPERPDLHPDQPIVTMLPETPPDTPEQLRSAINMSEVSRNAEQIPRAVVTRIINLSKRLAPEPSKLASAAHKATEQYVKSAFDRDLGNAA